MDIKDVKKTLKITNTDLANFFGFKNVLSYANSSQKKRLEKGIVSIFLLCQANQNNDVSPFQTELEFLTLWRKDQEKEDARKLREEKGPI